MRKENNIIYFLFVLKKSMIKENAEDEFQPNSNAIYKTYLLTDGEWIIADSFNVKKHSQRDSRLFNKYYKEKKKHKR